MEKIFLSVVDILKEKYYIFPFQFKYYFMLNSESKCLFKEVIKGKLWYHST